MGVHGGGVPYIYIYISYKSYKEGENPGILETIFSKNHLVWASNLIDGNRFLKVLFQVQNKVTRARLSGGCV